MKRSLPVLVLASLCVVSTAQATTYVRVEKDGTKTYSDRPIPGGLAGGKDTGHPQVQDTACLLCARPA